MNKASHIEDLLPIALDQQAMDENFSIALGSRLRKHIEENVRNPRQPRQLGFKLAWAFGILAFIIFSFTLILGPGKVWAQVQRWFGYFPGEGFIDSENVQVLGQTVSQFGQGNTLTIKNGLIQDGLVKVWAEFDQKFENPGEVWIRLGEGSLVKGGWSHEPDLAGSKGLLFTFKLPKPDSTVVALKTESGWNMPLSFVPGHGAFPPAENAILPGMDACASTLNLRFCAVGSNLQDEHLEVLVEIFSEDGKIKPYAAMTGLDYREILPSINTTPLLVGDKAISISANYDKAHVNSIRTNYWSVPLKFDGFIGEFGDYSLRLPGLLYTVPFSDSLIVDVGANPRDGQVILLDSDIEADGIKMHFSQAVILGDGTGELKLMAFSEPIDFTQSRFILSFEQAPPENGQDMYGGFFDGNRFALTLQIGKSFGDQTGKIKMSVLSATIFDNSTIDLKVMIKEGSSQPMITAIPDVVDGFSTPSVQQALPMDTFSETGESLKAGELLYSVLNGENSILYAYDPNATKPSNQIATLPGRLLQLFPMGDGSLFYTIGELNPGEEFGIPKQLYQYLPGRGEPKLVFADFPSNVDPLSLAISHSKRFLSFRSYEPIAGSGTRAVSKLVRLDLCEEGVCPVNVIEGLGDYAGWQFHANAKGWSDSRDVLILIGTNTAHNENLVVDLFLMDLEGFPAMKMTNLTEDYAPIVDSAYWAKDGNSIMIVRSSGDPDRNLYGIDEFDLTDEKTNTLAESLPWTEVKVLHFPDGQRIEAWSQLDLETNQIVIRKYGVGNYDTESLWSKIFTSQSDILRDGAISANGEWIIYRRTPASAVLFEVATRQLSDGAVCVEASSESYCTYEWVR